jgi:hypothetical protein
MSAAERSMSYRCKRLQQGATAVEFALLVLIFFTLVFGVIEFARLMFLFNTLPEVTRRAASAAATTDFTKPAELERVRQRAVFRYSAGALPLMKELTDEAVRIDYLAVKRNNDGSLSMVPIPPGSLPSSPAENRQVCLIDPNSPTCIRIVRVRVCKPSNSAACEPMLFRTMVSLIKFDLPLPTAPTLVKAQSLGLLPNGG